MYENAWEKDDVLDELNQISAENDELNWESRIQDTIPPELPIAEALRELCESQQNEIHNQHRGLAYRDTDFPDQLLLPFEVSPAECAHPLCAESRKKINNIGGI
jgi:hypothetical protein